MTGAKFDRATITRALELVDEGTSYRAVATELGTWPSTVQRWVNKSHLDPTLDWAPEFPVVDGAPHGTSGGYWTRGCRCRPCLDWRAGQAYDYNKDRMLGGQRRIMSSIGARRRVFALYAIGWDRALIADASGLSELSIKRLSETPQITRRKHYAVVRGYNALSMRPGPSVWHRSFARSRGYAPPLAWDDDTIDDPNAKPVGIKYVYADVHTRIPDTDILVAEVNRSGVAIVAERYGVTPGAINKVLARRGYRAVTRADQGQLPTYMKKVAA